MAKSKGTGNGGSKVTAKEATAREVRQEVREASEEGRDIDSVKGKRGRTSNRDLAERMEKRDIFVSILAENDIVQDPPKEGDQYATIYLHPHGQVIIKSRNFIAKGNNIFNPESEYVYPLSEEESKYYMGGDAMVNIDNLTLDDVAEFANDTVRMLKNAKGRKSLREIVEEARRRKHEEK